MAENTPTVPNRKAQDQPGQNDAKETSTAPVAVGRAQLGEKVEGTLTTRVPRGVGEPAADALASEHDGVKALQEHVQKTVDAENERGFRGEQVGGYDNHAYTVAGVTAGEPTPETTTFTPRGK
jgi:hypothetical protein